MQSPPKHTGHSTVHRWACPWQELLGKTNLDWAWPKDTMYKKYNTTYKTWPRLFCSLTRWNCKNTIRTPDVKVRTYNPNSIALTLTHYPSCTISKWSQFYFIFFLPPLTLTLTLALALTLDPSPATVRSHPHSLSSLPNDYVFYLLFSVSSPPLKS